MRKLIGNHGARVRGDQPVGHLQAPKMLVQARKTAPITEMATKRHDGPGHQPEGDRPAHRLGGCRQRKRATHADRGHEARHGEIADDPGRRRIARSPPAPADRQRPGQEHRGCQLAQGVEAAEELGDADLARHERAHQEGVPASPRSRSEAIETAARRPTPHWSSQPSRVPAKPPRTSPRVSDSPRRPCRTRARKKAE